MVPRSVQYYFFFLSMEKILYPFEGNRAAVENRQIHLLDKFLRQKTMIELSVRIG